jgi:hypothetical protein
MTKTSAFFMNSMPKSGTHLLKNMLKGLPYVNHDYRYEMYEGYPVQYPDHLAKLRELRSGEFGAGHIYFSPGWANLLKQLNMKQLFMIRDPRDIVVSYAHFIVEKYPQHELYHHLQQCKSWKERYLCFLHGIQSSNLSYPNIGIWLNRFTGWLDNSSTMTIRFEEFNCSRQSRQAKLEEVIRYIWKDRGLPLPVSELVALMEEQADPAKSITFRSGEIGTWRNEFDSEVKQLFKEIAGGKLIELGYEKDFQW